MFTELGHSVNLCRFADIVCGKLSQISLVSAENDFSGARTWTRVTRERYTLSKCHDSDFTTANCALQRGRYQYLEI